jgi:F-type H+-transporting ATPase subunit a
MLIALFVEQLPFTALLNRIFGGPVRALAEQFGFRVDRHAPIPNYVAMQILVVVLLIAFFVWVRSRLSVETPGSGQHFAELIHEFIGNQSREIIGPHGYQPYTSILIAMLLFILTSNLLGLVPGFESPTATPAVPLGCAIVAFVYYNYHGFRHSGFKYLKHFIGPVWQLAPLMFLIEVVSHLARMLSLTVRLFANIFAGDMLTLAFFSLIPIGVPIVFMFLHLGVSLVQAYIFVVLMTVYLGGAVGEEH